MENLKSVMQTIDDKRPDILKGRLLAGAYMHSSQGSSFRIKVENLELKNKRCQIYKIIEDYNKAHNIGVNEDQSEIQNSLENQNENIIA